MPPSGYSMKQSSSIGDFLKSVSDELKNESVSLGLGPEEGLQKEIGNIAEIQESNKFGKLSNIVLELTNWFYERILAKKPKTFQEYDEARATILEDVQEEILAIHVPPIGIF